MNETEKELLDHGLGNVTWWGYSPTFNILEDCTETDEKGKHVVKNTSSDWKKKSHFSLKIYYVTIRPLNWTNFSD